MKKCQFPPNVSQNPLYHDTWQLLKKYRDVIWCLELSIRQPGSHAKSIRQSRQMLDALNASLDLLRTKHKHGESYYWILYYSFLSPQKPLNAEETLEKLQTHIRDISRRTYYRKRREAIDALSAILWGYLSKDNADVLEHFFPLPPAESQYSV